MKLTLDSPWLVCDLGAPHQVLSWSITRPGFVTADRIVWREVRNADLSPDLNVETWLTAQLQKLGQTDAVTLLTSRTIDAFETAEAVIDGQRAFCVATTGLSNAERIGTRLDRSGKDWGTINVAVQVSAGLSQAALIETLSVATQARTTAIIDTGYALPTGVATGTGTDCIAVAAPSGYEPFAGLHTAIGEAVGQAVYAAVYQGAKVWMESVRRPDCD